MPRYDFAAPRLFVEEHLAADVSVPLNADQANYLRAVLRLRANDRVLAFNGRDGEWACEVASPSRKTVSLAVREKLREQTQTPILHYLFAPLKHARLDYAAQKAVEMGVTTIQPVITRRTQARSVNQARLRANAIEAAEQCGILQIPEVAPPRPLEAILRDWPEDQLLVFCDEDAEIADPIAALRDCERGDSIAVLIGPEGGFEEAERISLLAIRRVAVLSLGPRILRADTAAVAALALVQAVLGDWR